MKTIFLAAALATGLCAASATAADVQTNWDKQCALCHGKDGTGQTKMGVKLKLKDYTDASVQAEFTDDEAEKAIREGVKQDGKTRMKAYGSKLTDEEIKELVAHVRSLKK